MKRIFSLLLMMCLVWASCNRAKKRVKDSVSSAKNKIENAGDKVIRTFDSQKPDTKFNKKRFKEFFGFEPGADVSKLYCHADEMGIDHSYQFAFRCDETTVEKIIKELNLKLVKNWTDDGGSFRKQFDWWDEQFVVKTSPYFVKEAHESYSYLWFDKTKNTAYYYTFDM